MSDETTPTPSSELLKTRNSAPDVPGAGGWVPGRNTPMWAAIVIGTLFASGPAIGAAVSEWNVKAGIAVGSVLLGIAGSLATYFGTRSAGPRR